MNASAASEQVWLQITAGNGPVECDWAVVQVMKRVTAELDASLIDLIPGDLAGTARSVLLSITGPGCVERARPWCGTIQWIARSPFRPGHRRRNWFVGVALLQPVSGTQFREQDLTWETMRASGPGGQHVNRTESAVRVTHRPTGLQATAAEERSQHRNRRLALARLAQRVADEDGRRLRAAQGQRWELHHRLERGNPIRILRQESE